MNTDFNRSLYLLVILSFFGFSIANAQNKVVREINSFDKVKVSDNVKVTFKKAEQEKITIVAEGLGYDKIMTESSGRELKIKIKTGIFKSADVQIEVEYVTLRSIEASNQADVKFAEVLKGDEISLSEINKRTGNAGRYAAFRAIAHDLAIWVEESQTLVKAK